MDIYTFVAEYKGGTYIRQVKALSMPEACVAWGRLVAEHDDIPVKNAASFATALRKDISDMPPACLDSIPNVWYFMADAGKGFVHINIVKTLPETSEWQPEQNTALRPANNIRTP